MRTRLKSWCQSNASGRGRCRGCLASVCLCRCCCGPENGDKTFRGQQTQNSHLEKCQSFYQGLSQNGPLQGPGGLSGSLSGGPYHPAAFTAKKSRTLGVGQNGQLTSGLIGSAHTTSRVIIFLHIFSHNGAKDLCKMPISLDFCLINMKWNLEIP